LNSEKEIAEKCKYILLAVKPQTVGEVLEKIAPVLTDDSVIISICAGISEQYIQSRTSANQKVVCVMPNTPMMIGAGASAVAFGAGISDEEREFVCSVFYSCGIYAVIPPEKMNEVICINGSSPAFIFSFMKCFTDYAVEQGIDELVARNLFSATLRGCAEMLDSSMISLDELIAQVTSKGGTTEAGLKALQENGFEQAVKAACEACTKRAYELGEEK
jgi:pyrroline-5-carboxylate reductase